MKKTLVLFLFLVLFAAACSNLSDSQEEEQEVSKEETTEENETEEESETEKNETVIEHEETNGSEKTEEPKQEESTENNENDKDQSEKSEKPTEEQLTELGFNIFEAQRNEDYNYLKEVLSKGSSLNKENKSFTFENVTYPHEQKFIQANKDDIEFRYTHEENAETFIVGFAVIDYEAESSFTIDFQFMKQDGEWKMNDMDMNK